MSLIQDIQFVPRLSIFIPSLKHTGGYTWACRCPYCGDSKKNKTKRRGGFYRGTEETSDMILYSCFNCGVVTTLGKVIEKFSPELYNEYKVDAYVNREGVAAKPDESIFAESSRELKDVGYDEALASIHRLDALPLSHPAVRYVDDRKIPHELWHLFYFAPKFMTWTNALVKKFDTRLLENDYPRLIIPFFNEHGRMFAFAARAFGKEEPKYYTIKLVEEEEKIYGRERLDYSKPILAVEGQIDSMLLPNCIGVSGSSFDTPYVQGIKTNVTLIPDNEPRNVQIVAQYKKYIDAGYRVCMLPDSFKYKDINEAVQGGMSIDEIVDVINENSFQGLEAAAKFMTWQKCDVYNHKIKRSEPDHLEKYR